LLIAALLGWAPGGSVKAGTKAARGGLQPRITKAVAFDVSASLRELARRAPVSPEVHRLPPERGPVGTDHGFQGDQAVQSAAPAISAQIGGTIANFEGLSNADNPFELSPPDPNGEAGPNHYV
jgi:hypothetical protein